MGVAGESRQSEAILRVDHLSVQFSTRAGLIHAVDDVSFSLASGEALGIVGESGSGKSVLARSLLRLRPASARVEAAAMSLGGRDLLGLAERDLAAIRGADISIVFQDPLSSLNPTLTIGYQLRETLVLHLKLRRAAARATAIHLLETVGLPDPVRLSSAYPFELSGGMRQRVMIAMAIACHPRVLIADEPTTALDVTVQAQVMDLILQLRRTFDLALILISHDLGLVARVVDRVAVMYAGRFVEMGPVSNMLGEPIHPYSAGLLHSAPRLDQPRSSRLTTVPGAPPDAARRPTGCAFHPRCPLAVERCERETPALKPFGPDHFAACWVKEAQRSAQLDGRAGELI